MKLKNRYIRILRYKEIKKKNKENQVKKKKHIWKLLVVAEKTLCCVARLHALSWNEHTLATIVNKHTNTHSSVHTADYETMILYKMNLNRIWRTRKSSFNEGESNALCEARRTRWKKLRLPAGRKENKTTHLLRLLFFNALATNDVAHTCDIFNPLQDTIIPSLVKMSLSILEYYKYYRSYYIIS